MGIEIRLPNITGKTEKEQLSQMRSYLFQLREQLQWAFDNISATEGQSGYAASHAPVIASAAKTVSAYDADVTFSSIKSLIIKSAEIVDAYYEEMNKRFESAYVAQSDFGTFAQAISQNIEANSTEIEQVFTNVQTINTNVSKIDTTVKTIDTNLKTVENNVGALDTNIKSVENNVGKLDTNLKTVEENVGAIDSNVKTVEGNVNKIDSNLKNVEENVGNIDTNLKEVEGNVGQLETNLQDAKTGIGANLETLSSEVGQIDTDIQGVKAGIDNNVKELTKDIGDLDTSLKNMKDEVDGELKDVKDEIESIIYTLVEVNASIKSGLLYTDDNGIPIYGLEIGQRNTVDGVEVFNKFARFTSDRLSFYDRNGTEVAYISDYKLHITNAEIMGTLKLGAFLLDTTKGFRLKWVGRG